MFDIDYINQENSDMNRAQKIAIYNLIMIISGMAVVLLTSFMKLPDLVYVIEIVIVFALVFTSPVFFKKKQGRVSFDERDAIINQRAMLVASCAAFGCLGGQCIVPIIEVGLDGSIRVYAVLGIYLGTLITFVVSKSLTVLFQYGWGPKGEKL
jgi:hypothetical protein